MLVSRLIVHNCDSLEIIGDVVLQLKSPCQDGTTHILMSHLEFMQ